MPWRLLEVLKFFRGGRFTMIIGMICLNFWRRLKVVLIRRLMVRVNGLRSRLLKLRGMVIMLNRRVNRGRQFLRLMMAMRSGLIWWR